MVVFNPHSVDILKMSPSPLSSSSHLNRLPQTPKPRKDPPGNNVRRETSNLNQYRLPFTDNGGALESRHGKTTLEQQARIFFKLAYVSDRRESRYNAHGNRGSFHGQKHKLHKNVFSGSEVIDSMVASGLVSSRGKALSLGNRLSMELNLFSRANPTNAIVSPEKPKGRARANVLAAQTILLGMSGELEAPGTAVSFLATSEMTAAEGCFIDDSNAFYRFGPGVLAILRGIDGDPDAPRSDAKELSTTNKPATRSSGAEEMNTERNRKTKKKNGKKKHEHPYVKRNLSITPNAPGCNRKIVLEDLFLQRNPEMASATHANTAVAAPSANNFESESNAKVSKNSSKKKNKKPTAVTNQPSISTPSPQPKSILKNSGGNKSKNKKKKPTSSKATKSKTKGKQKKTAHKIKAGAKIKFISDKERKIVSIEKRLRVYHSEQQIVLYREMLKELKNRLSRLYTGDHIEIISLSSHSSYPPSPIKHQTISSFDGTKNIAFAEQQTLVDDYETGGGDDDEESEKDDTFDTALGSLEDIISNNADLLAVGDDNASVWTEFIMGTSRGNAGSNANVNGNVNADPNCVESEANTKENPNQSLQVLKSSTREEPEKRDFVYSDFQQKQPKKIHATSAWKAPAPLDSDHYNSPGKDRSANHSDGNEIDLSSWAMVNRDQDVEVTETADWIKNSAFLNQTVHPTSDFETVNDTGMESSTVSSKNGDSSLVDSSLVDGGSEDENSSFVPDNLSLLLERQQKKEFQSRGIVSKGQKDNKKSSFRRENTKRIIPETPRTKNYTVSSIVSIQSNATRDSNDLAKLRLVPLARKGDTEMNPSSLEKELMIDRQEARHLDYHRVEFDEARVEELPSESPPSPPTQVDDDASSASDDTSSGIMEAIEKDPFYQLAAEAKTLKSSPTEEESSHGERNGSESSPTSSEPGSFTASYNDSHSQDSFDDFDGEEATIDTYSDEGSYMELTVGEEEIEEEDIKEEEEEVIEEDDELYEEITVVSESNHIRNHSQSPDTIGTRPALSPRRKAAQFRSSMHLPSVPELGPEPEPEPEPQPTSPKRENSVYVEVHSMPEDDEMTQITMDCFFNSSFRSNRSLHIIPEDDYTINNGDYSNHNSYLFPLNDYKEAKSGGSAIVSPIRNRNSRSLKKSAHFVSQKNLLSVQQHLKQRTKYVSTSFSSSSPLRIPCNTVLPTETSQERIQEILWKDLPSSDVTVTWSALEELRILVANETRSRAYFVRHGGVMVIIDTMAEQLEVEVIQFLCCNILEQLASMDFEIGLTILELGGVSLIEQSTRKHANSDRVKQMGDAALRTLLRNS